MQPRNVVSGHAQLDEGVLQHDVVEVEEKRPQVVIVPPLSLVFVHDVRDLPEVEKPESRHQLPKPPLEQGLCTHGDIVHLPEVADADPPRRVNGRAPATVDHVFQQRGRLLQCAERVDQGQPFRGSGTAICAAAFGWDVGDARYPSAALVFAGSWNMQVPSWCVLTNRSKNNTNSKCLQAKKQRNTTLNPPTLKDTTFGTITRIGTFLSNQFDSPNWPLISTNPRREENHDNNIT